MKPVLLAAVSAMILSACSQGENVAASSGKTLSSGEGAARITAALPPMTSEGYFKLKPGVWTRTDSVNGVVLKTDQVCIDESVYEHIQPLRDIQWVVAANDCDEVQQDATSDGVKFATTCRSPLGPTEVKGVTAGGDALLRTTLTATGLPAERVVESKWSGPCAAGVAAGDVLDAEGTVVASVRQG